MKLRERVLDWIERKIVAKREPDLYIGGRENTYMKRWYVVPRNPVFNIYYHHFMRSDFAEALHDHPWSFNASWLLRGTYQEHTFDTVPDRKNRVTFYQRAQPGLEELLLLRPLPAVSVTRVNEGAFKWRWGKSPHRVELDKGFTDLGRADLLPAPELPVDTIFITGPKMPGMAKWGFYCAKGWKHWQDFLHKYGADHTSVENKGCD